MINGYALANVNSVFSSMCVHQCLVVTVARVLSILQPAVSKHSMGLQSYLNHSLIAAILVCVTAVTDDSDESQGDSPDYVTMPEESHNLWPLVIVYLIVHIIGDVINVLRLLTWFNLSFIHY